MHSTLNFAVLGSDPFGGVGLSFVLTFVVGLVLPVPAFVGGSRVNLECTWRDDELRCSSATSDGMNDPLKYD